ncbi:MAG: hypothetical protein BWK76_20610 [Desulfobulbaceae bacterium A2]|nr:MAG: hypothetical protein BWK76_20610 [Desulfobulbaceae bacterium A2]
MIVICEDCGKKYSVNPARIKGATARVRCRACDHLMIITKPAGDGVAAADEFGASGVPSVSNVMAAAAAESQAASGPSPGREAAADEVAGGGKEKRKSGLLVIGGLKTSTYLLLNFVVFILTLAVILALVYLRNVPPMLRSEAALRVEAISQTLAASVRQPILLRNYLQVNQLAEGSSKLPGVAYVAILNAKGGVIAGIFGNPARFDNEFALKIKNTGFPAELAARNRLSAKDKSKAQSFTVGGQGVQDVAVALPDGGGEVHVGLFIDDIDRLAQQSLYPMLIILGLMTLAGLLSFTLLARGIVQPIRQLTDIAHRISVGEVNLAVAVRGSHEINDLAASLERLRLSIRLALERLQGGRG